MESKVKNKQNTIRQEITKDYFNATKTQKITGAYKTIGREDGLHITG